MPLFPVAPEKSKLLSDPVDFVAIRAARHLESEAAGVSNLTDAREDVIEVGAAVAQRHGGDPAIGLAQAILYMDAADSMAVRRELFAGHVAKAGAVSGVIVDLQHWMRNTLHKSCETGGIEVRL